MRQIIMESKAFRLNKEDIVKILKGLAIAMGGAGCAYLLAQLQVLETNQNLAIYAGIASAIINALQRWITGQTK